MAKTIQPTGLTITRSGNSYVFKWKIADKDYSSGQTLQYRTKSLSAGWRSWVTVSIGATTTSKSVSIPKTDFYPVEEPYCLAIEFRVRGKRGNYTQKGKTIKPDWSEWTNKVMDISIPRAPSLSASLGDVWNVSQYTWSIVSNNDDAKIFTQYQWQTILVKNCNTTDGSKLKWSSSNSGWDTGSGTAVSYTKTITEDTTIASDSYTRWFRIRSRGQAGNSEWKYAKHVFALPNSATIKSHKVTKKADRYLLDLVWEASTSASRPIDETTVEYAKEVPIANMLPPAEPSWNTGQVSKDTAGNDKASFHISGLLDDDYCLFARVVTKHDDRENYSAVRLVAKGKLADPSDVSVTLSGNVATVSATNNSSASIYTGSVATTKRLFLQVYYKGKKYYKSGISVGIIPYGSSSEQITIPRPTGETAYSIGVRAVVGTYTRSTASDGTYRYTVKADMVSQRVWTTADVPVSPSNLQADYDGNLNVTWDWSWDDAEGVEISWSTDEDAWVSTESPETYTIDGQATRLVIKNIDAGTRYYIRARFKSGDDFSDYSNTISVETTLPPEKPVLSLSSGVISESGKVTASWNYVSNDGTEQDYAEIICNNEVIAHTSYGTHITMYAEDLEWQSGNEYGLKLRVKSVSGSFSDYSDTEYVRIAPAITCTISETSLEEQHIEIGNRTHEGDIVSFNSDDNPIIKSLVANIDYNADGVSEVSITRTGKNLLWNMRADTYTTNGITFTKTADGKVIANGTATANAWYKLTEGFVCKEPMILSGCPFGGSSSKYEIQLDGVSNVRDFGSGVSFNTSGSGKFYIVVRSGQTVNNLVFEPMVRLATESEEYEPYQGTAITKSLGQTVYGGTLDLISGVLTSTLNADGTEKATPEVIQLTGEQIETLLGVNNIWADSGEVSVETVEEMRDILSLTELPLTIKVDGANKGDITQLILERAEQYSMDRPDESTFNGYEGEAVYITNQTGDAMITINTSDLIGFLDDGAKYRIIATVKDGIGQTATDEIYFEVHWNHQAIEPTGTVVIDGTIAKVTPIAPQGTENGDVCDIYRLSSDKPVLIYPNAEFGTTYVDPYPAINGGYRLVFKTSNGDYITEDERPAWVDIDSEFEYDKSIIEFAKDKVELYYNVDADSSWSKDFIETQYLGGSVQGDWNPAVSRSGDISGLVLDDFEPETVTALRRLAVYSGICNVRTTKGSSYHANVDVSESAPHDRYGMITEFSLSITRVDPQGYDGVPLTVWEE